MTTTPKEPHAIIRFPNGSTHSVPLANISVSPKPGRWQIFVIAWCAIVSAAEIYWHNAPLTAINAFIAGWYFGAFWPVMRGTSLARKP